MGLLSNFGKKSKILFYLIVVSVCNPLFGASKKKNVKTEPEPAPVTVENVTEENSESSIKLPSKKRTYFYKIDTSILDDIEEGSPASIKNGVMKLRQNASNLDETEKVLITVAAEIMKAVYPSESVNWDTYSVNDDNPYIGAINSVNQGVYDLSTGNVDFLTMVLPSLLVTKNTFTSASYADCEKSLKAALELKTDSTLANYLMATLKMKQGNYADSVLYFSKAYSKASDSKDISIAYANSLRLNGNLAKAGEILGAVAGDKTDLAVLKQNAYIAFDSIDLANAELYVAKVLQQTPNDLEFLLFRAKILMEKKDYIHAVSLLDMYGRQDSTSIEYLVLRARIQLEWSKNTASAAETIEKALQLYPDSIDALMIASKISSMIDSPVAGKYADELAELVLKSKPDNIEAMTYALDGLIQRENWNEAYNIGKKIIDLNNADSEMVEKYVTVCIKLNKNKEAFDYAKKYYDVNPDDETLLQAYIYAYCETGSRDAVLKYINSLLNTSSPKIKSYLYYRRSFLQLTEDNALADLRSSLISNPRNSDSLFRLYEMYYGKEDYRKAQYYLRQVVAINPNDTSVKKLNEALTKLIK